MHFAEDAAGRLPKGSVSQTTDANADLKRPASPDHTVHTGFSLRTSSHPQALGREMRERGAESELGPGTDVSHLDRKTSIVLMKSMSWSCPQCPSPHLWAVIRKVILQMRKWVTQTLLGLWPFPVNGGPGRCSIRLVFRFEVCYKSQRQDQWLIFSLFSITSRKRNTPKSRHESACELVPIQPWPSMTDSHLSLVFTSVKWI